MLTALPDQSIGNGITSINPYPFIFRSHYNLSDIWKDIKGETDVFLDFIESQIKYGIMVCLLDGEIPLSIWKIET